MPKRRTNTKKASSLSNFRKSGKQYMNVLRGLIDQKKRNVVRQSLGMVSSKLRRRKTKRR
jgi:hypothetical protein